MAASIRDVAKRANVGPATVSRVLNNNGYVSEETRAKIEAAMRELHYTPNELARNLFHKKTGIIAVLVPSVANPFLQNSWIRWRVSCMCAGIRPCSAIL